MTEKAKSSNDGTAGGQSGGRQTGGATQQSTPQNTMTTEEAVGFFLRRNPDFLAEFLESNPDMLLKIRPPEGSAPDGVIDLRHVMLERLRGEVTRLTDQQRGIISASRANLTIQNRIHSAALQLLDAESFQQLIDTIATDLPAMLDLDVAALVIERSSTEDGFSIDTPGVHVVPPGFIESQLDDQEIVLQAEIAGDEHLYGTAGRQVRSQALVRLTVSSETPPCMLALGSREADMFQEGMRTDLTAFLARIMERCIRLWLELPE